MFSPGDCGAALIIHTSAVTVQSVKLDCQNLSTTDSDDRVLPQSPDIQRHLAEFKGLERERERAPGLGQCCRLDGITERGAAQFPLAALLRTSAFEPSVWKHGRRPADRQNWDFLEDASQQHGGVLQVRRRQIRTDPDHQAADRLQIQGRGAH